MRKNKADKASRQTYDPIRPAWEEFMWLAEYCTELTPQPLAMWVASLTMELIVTNKSARNDFVNQLAERIGTAIDDDFDYKDQETEEYVKAFYEYLDPILTGLVFHSNSTVDRRPLTGMLPRAWYTRKKAHNTIKYIRTHVFSTRMGRAIAKKTKLPASQEF